MTTRALGLAVCLALAAPAAWAEHWRLDPVHTQIRFAVDHLGFSRSMGLVSIAAGELDFDPKQPEQAKLDVHIDLTTLNLGDTKWNETVKSWQFLHVKDSPEARYVSTAVQANGDGSGTIHGMLTLHGKTQLVDVAFRLNKVGNDPYSFKRTAGFSATARLTRSAFGMDKLLSAVGDTIELDIAVEAQRARAAKAGDSSKTEDEHEPAQ